MNQFKVFYQFHYSDRVKESGITFRQKMTEDAGRHYKAVHYDHGNGIAVADVDGDGLYDIYFTNQIGGNELWKNLGGGKFKDITESGVGVPGRISVSASFADIDNDGSPDLSVTTVLGGNLLCSRTTADGHFSDISKSLASIWVRIPPAPFSMITTTMGLVDLLVATLESTPAPPKTAGRILRVGFADAFHGHLFPERFEYPVLARKMGHDRFKDVTRQSWLHPYGWAGDATFVDFFVDGWVSFFFQHAGTPPLTMCLKVERSLSIIFSNIFPGPLGERWGQIF